MKNRLKLSIFLVLGLFLINSDQTFSEERTLKPKSESNARGLCIVGILVPVSAGGLIWALDQPDKYGRSPNRTIPIVLILTGIVTGPSYGYFYAQQPGRGMLSIGIRLGIGAATWWATEVAQRSSETSAKFFDHPKAEIVAVGALGILVSGIYDIVKVKNAVRKYNKALLEKETFILTPKYFAESQALGLGIGMKF